MKLEGTGTLTSDADVVIELIDGPKDHSERETKIVMLVHKGGGKLRIAEAILEQKHFMCDTWLVNPVVQFDSHSIMDKIHDALSDLSVIDEDKEVIMVYPDPDNA